MVKCAVIENRKSAIVQNGVSTSPEEADSYENFQRGLRRRQGFRDLVGNVDFYPQRKKEVKAPDAQSQVVYLYKKSF